jgi:hypothetical protein
LQVLQLAKMQVDPHAIYVNVKSDEQLLEACRHDGEARGLCWMSKMYLGCGGAGGLWRVAARLLQYMWTSGCAMQAARRQLRGRRAL